MEACVRGDSLTEDPLARVSGIMYVSGYVMSIKEDGRAGIVSVRGGGGKFVLIQLSHFYVNQKLVEKPHTLHTFLQRGSYINLFIEDLGRERMIVTFKVRYESAMCWIGTHSNVPDVGPYREFWKRWVLECSKIPPDTSYDIYVDVPVSSLSEHSGIVYWCSETYGLVSMKERRTITNALFSADCFYLGKRKFLSTENLAYPTADTVVGAITKPISRRIIFGVAVEMEAVVVYLGDKPVFNFIYRDPQPVVHNNGCHKFEDQDNCRQVENSEENKAKSWADEANEDLLKEKRICSIKPLLPEVTEKPPCQSRTASYLTGHFSGVFGGYLVYGSQGRSCRFTMENFHVSKLKLSSVKAVIRYLSSQAKAPILHGYVTALSQPVYVGPNVRILWEAECVWHGPAPAALKVKINSLKKVPLRTVAAAPTSCGRAPDNLVDRRDLMASLPQIPFNDSVKRGRLAGYVLSCSASDAIVTGFSNTVYLTRERFYVNGQKYRGTSLVSYFQRRNDKVNTYIVPMEVRVIRGCAVYSRAVCAWIGDEPADLQKKILTDKIYTNFEVCDTREKSEGQFYYMVGHVQKMGETCGFIECQVDSRTVNVGFSIHEVYKYGKKVSSRSILSMHSQVLLTSRWCVLAHCSPHPAVPGSNYTAVAVWHHDDQVMLFDEFQSKLSLWHKQLLAGKCACADSVAALVDKAYSSVSKGAVTERREDEVAVGIKDRGIVYVKRDHIVVDGCTCCLSKVDLRRMCYVAFDANKSPLYAWMGRQPGCDRAGSNGVDISHVDCTSDDSDAESDCDVQSDDDDPDLQTDDDDEEYDEYQTLLHDLASMELSDPSELLSWVKRAQSAQKTTKTAKRKSEVVSRGELDNFSGLHATGHIVVIQGNYAILSSYSEKVKGTIFVYLDIDHLYINGEPFKRTCYTQFDGKRVLVSHVCHFYLNTMPESQQYGLLEICATASAAWIGHKPVFMPPPGKQGRGIFDTKALRIAYTKPPHHYVEFCSYESWLDHLKTHSLTDACDWEHQFPPGFLFAETTACKNEEEQPNSEVASEHHSNGHATSRFPAMDLPAAVVSAQNFTTPMPGNQNGCNGASLVGDSVSVDRGHELLAASTLECADVLAQRTGNYSASSENAPVAPTHVGGGSSVGLDEFLPSRAPQGGADTAPVAACRGRITELHPHLGKLRATDGTSHYFKSEQFFLFGIPLHDVELYDVLIQDLEVLYHSDASGDLLVCWYGSRLLDPVSCMLLNQWCADNFVSDDVRNLLTARANFA